MTGRKQNYLLVSFASFGHYIPFVELSRRLLREGHAVTLLVASSELDQLRHRKILTLEDEAAIRITEVAYQRPPLSSKGDQRPVDIFRKLDVMLQTQIPVTVAAMNKTFAKSIVSGEKVDVAVIDYYLTPAASACVEPGIPYFIFNTGAPLMALSLLTITQATPGDENLLKWPTLKNFVNKDTVNALMRKMSLENQQFISKSAGFILNGFRGIAEDLVAIVRKSPLLKNVPIFQIGPLFEGPQITSATDDELTSKVHKWLDGQAEGSVVYMSFGTVALPSMPQMAELANALLKLKRPFIWSLQAQCYHNIPQLGDGFPESQTPESPFLILPWSPQKTILGHKATGLFVTHSGWNSTFECLASGKPVVSWPMFSDQYLNAEWLDGLGIGVMVHGTGMVADRVVPVQEILETFNRVLSGEKFKSQALAWKKKVAAATEAGGSYHSDFAALLSAAAEKS